MAVEDIGQLPYRLSEEDHSTIYSIIRNAFSFVSVENPVMYYLGGQPGSGKTMLRNQILRQTDAIVINVDELRWFHPEFSRLIEDQSTNIKAAYLVNPDASEWSISLLEEAIRNNCNIIIDSTLGGKVKHFVDRMERLYTLGYQNEIHVLAIQSKVSRLGIYLRFETNRAQGDLERMVSMEVHDRNFISLPENILALQAECATRIHKFCVYSRNYNFELNKIFESLRPCDFDLGVSALNEERNRNLNEIEEETLRQKVEEVVGLIKLREGDFSEFREAMK